MRRTLAGAWLGAFMAVTSGCHRVPVLNHLLEVRQRAADLRLHFSKAVDASNRAVMATTDGASGAAVHESGDLIRAIREDTQALRPILQDLVYGDEVRLLNEFDGLFDKYLALDRTILALAAENTNLKAEQLSFGPAREAAQAFRHSLGGVLRSAVSKEPKGRCDVELLIARADAAVREIQLLESPHIAESDEAEMSRMEAEMEAAETEARLALRSLKDRVGPVADLDAAAAALDRFKAINVKLVGLSRRNSNVRSLSLSLGRKRTLAAACDDALCSLQAALQKHEFTATR